MEVTAHHAEHWTEPAHERRRERLQHRHLQPAAAAGRGDLGADEPRADHHDAWTVVETGAEVERVVDRAQHEDAVERGRSGKGARGRAGGEQCAVERELSIDRRRRRG